MNTLFKEWIDVVSKLVTAFGILIAALNYRSQTKTKRAEWLKALFEKFYETERFKEVRRWIESGEIESKIKLNDIIVTDEEEKLADYLNFFEFIATLEAEGQLKTTDVSNLFDYYLKKISKSDICKAWIDNPKYSFEKLKVLLHKLQVNGRQYYLFVYGTLRNKYALKLKDRVSRELEYIGRAKINASLYDLGRYPGAIKENEKSEVIGDVFLINNPDKVFKLLDEYEGEKFSREKEEVNLRGGKSLNAWIYWYNQNPAGKRRIHYKDYLNYLKSKKTA